MSFAFFEAAEQNRVAELRAALQANQKVSQARNAWGGTAFAAAMMAQAFDAAEFLAQFEDASSAAPLVQKYFSSMEAPQTHPRLQKIYAEHKPKLLDIFEGKYQLALPKDLKSARALCRMQMALEGRDCAGLQLTIDSSDLHQLQAERAKQPVLKAPAPVVCTIDAATSTESPESHEKQSQTDNVVLQESLIISEKKLTETPPQPIISPPQKKKPQKTLPQNQSQQLAAAMCQAEKIMIAKPELKKKALVLAGKATLNGEQTIKEHKTAIIIGVIGALCVGFGAIAILQ